MKQKPIQELEDKELFAKLRVLKVQDFAMTYGNLTWDNKEIKAVRNELAAVRREITKRRDSI